ncbi:MAG: haloacid dehalogenase-like hydrolase [Nannocystaceae bacterium]|nr:haloacid dehalogenase-like hydrolase [Nannocystaceae bacterium]
MSESNTAAFFRAEGTLIKSGVVQAAAYMASQRAGMRERLLRFGQAALAAPIFGVLGQNDRTLGNRVAHLSYRDITDDRVAILAEEYVEDILQQKILDAGLELMKQAKKDGHRIVVISEGISEIMEGLLPYLRHVDELICNRLEYKDRKATGTLLDPIVGGYDGGTWLKEYARKHEIDLERSVAFAGHGPDLLLLSSVGHPCAVNPDFTLRKAAKEADWPVMEYTA